MIVSNGMKIDLHIHSAASSKKDGRKVRGNTKDNISVLANKLNENGVNICAITDHDVFSFEMYQALKSYENADISIKKVLPGVEFSVCFLDSAGEEKTIHIVSIFSDNNNEKIKNIEVVLNDIKQDKPSAYSESTFLEILRRIDLDTILIAHQKESLSSKKTRKNDVATLGNQKFLELVATDYFEAYEFKNKRNEILNKSHLMSNNLQDSVRFVTGTDCHDWSIYPKESAEDNTIDFPYTYAKCLPTFKGLVMAVTDRYRLKTVDSFFNADKFTLSSIEIENHNKKISIPLSKGINVIIGDNSIGKSMLLHALTGFKKDGKPLPNDIRKGYEAYIKKNGLKIKQQVSKENLFCFDMQGEVRSKFENHLLVTTEFAKYFPPNINVAPYKTIIYNEIDRLIKHLNDKFELDRAVASLQSFKIYIDETSPESLSFIGDLRKSKKKTTLEDDVISGIEQIEIDIKNLLKFNIDQKDKDYFNGQLQNLLEIKNKYKKRKNNVISENEKIEIVAKTIDSAVKKHKGTISDTQKRQTSFYDHSNLLKEKLLEIIKQNTNSIVYKPNIEKTNIEFAFNSVKDYNFVSKIKISCIDNEYFLTILNKVIKSPKKSLDWNKITEKELQNSLLKYDPNVPILEFLRNALVEIIEDDFVHQQSITLKDSEKDEELSAGLNAKIYFDLLSHEDSLNGIYIIDQPEDNVSQPSIKEYLLECFKIMGGNRQVILVTHNPQFIVNLDVDNLIFMRKNTKDELIIQSGALEYECDDYNVLKLVADNIDGGLDSIQKRWKRYEKVNRV